MQQWRSVFRQLIARQFLTVDMKGFGSLLLTEQSKPLLQGETQVFLRRDERIKKPARKQREKTPVQANEPDLLEKLKARRRQLAVEQGLPPYVIFHDSTLMEMANIPYPPAPEELLQVSGVGLSKLEKYGETFLAVIRSHQNEPSTEI